MRGLVVPAYFDPAVAVNDWAALIAVADRLGLVVLNLAGGPGDRRDPAVGAAVARVRDAGVLVAGYVDTAYGRRSPATALVELAHYWEWYGVDSVFFDRSATDVERVHYYRTLAASARVLGARLVAFNHGAHPAPQFAEHADLLGTFEGSWPAYRDLDVPGWVHDCPADMFFHLVYDVPVGEAKLVGMLAAARNVGAVQHTERQLPDQWSRLPVGFADTLD